MNATIVLAALVAVVLVISAVQSVQIASISGMMGAKSSVITGSASGGIDMTGWTADEKMMYEHHGTLPQRIQSSSQQAPLSAMVGGC